MKNWAVMQRDRALKNLIDSENCVLLWSNRVEQIENDQPSQKTIRAYHDWKGLQVTLCLWVCF